MLNVIDQFTHRCPAIRLARKLKVIDVTNVLSDLFNLRGTRAISGPTMAGVMAKVVQEWITAVGAKTAHITPGSLRGERRFNARLRDELLDGEIFYALR